MKKYRVIYADPPWEYESKKTGGSMKSGAADHYATMTLQQIKDFPVKHIAYKNSVCFLWATNPLLPEAIEVMKAWGFDYKTTITWKKVMSQGMGYWWRGQTEFLLFGVRGNMPAFRMQEKNIIEAKVGKHSEKPEVFRELIERATKHLPYKIELFARKPSPGWYIFGDQVEGIEIIQPAKVKELDFIAPHTILSGEVAQG